MYRVMHSEAPTRGKLRILGSAMTISAVALVVSGCSSDATRFDFPTFGLNSPEKSAQPKRADRAFSYRPDTPKWGASNDFGDQRVAKPQRDYRRDDVRVAELPPQQPAPQPYAAPSPQSDPYSSAPSRPVQFREPVVQEPVRRASTGGSITVERGDTLFGLSRRHGVSVDALRRANGLSGSSIRVGQQLVLPGSAPADSGRTRVAAAESRVITPAAREETSSRYVVQSGDSIYAIARRNGVTAQQIIDANNISDPTRLRIGQRLLIPGQSMASNLSSTEEPGSATPVSRPAPRRLASARSEPDAGYRSPSRMRVIRSDSVKRAQPKAAPTRKPRRVAALPAPEPLSSGKFRWPVRGPIISEFGKRGDGSQNDGIDLAVPQGTEIKATENGVVAYAGTELKNYGQLILIRHADNWVSAYAHNSQMLVKRGDTVRRGQVIARAGATGAVTRPQLHFELRKGSKPVNPLKYLASN